jgi:hypothetical protein
MQSIWESRCIVSLLFCHEAHEELSSREKPIVLFLNGAVPPAATDQTAPSAAALKRGDCQASTQSLQGQNKPDQMQLCVVQARLNCLKQAIDKKVVGQQRRDFVKNCVGGGDEPM